MSLQTCLIGKVTRRVFGWPGQCLIRLGRCFARGVLPDFHCTIAQRHGISSEAGEYMHIEICSRVCLHKGIDHKYDSQCSFHTGGICALTYTI